MNEDAKQLATASLIQYLQHEVKKRQKEDADELKQMFKKLSSWMDDSLGQLLDSINDNTQSIDKRLNVLTEEVGTLENKLSYITKERDDLLNIVNNLGSKSPSIKSLSEPGQGNDHSNLYDSIVGPNNVKQVQTRAEIAAKAGEDQNTENNIVGGSAQHANLSSPDKSSQVAEVGHICQECNLAFSNSEYLNVHMRNFHSLNN